MNVMNLSRKNGKEKEVSVIYCRVFFARSGSYGGAAALTRRAWLRTLAGVGAALPLAPLRPASASPNASTVCARLDSPTKFARNYVTN